MKKMRPVNFEHEKEVPKFSLSLSLSHHLLYKVTFVKKRSEWIHFTDIRLMKCSCSPFQIRPQHNTHKGPGHVCSIKFKSLGCICIALLSLSLSLSLSPMQMTMQLNEVKKNIAQMMQLLLHFTNVVVATAVVVVPSATGPA